MSILLVSNEEALKTLIASEKPLELKNFAETVVDFREPAENFTKSEEVNNKRTMISIILNFLLIIGVSVYNLWQFRMLSGLDKEIKNEKASSSSGFSISLKTMSK